MVSVTPNHPISEIQSREEALPGLSGELCGTLLQVWQPCQSLFEEWRYWSVDEVSTPEIKSYERNAGHVLQGSFGCFHTSGPAWPFDSLNCGARLSA